MNQHVQPAAVPAQPYDPAYDPLVDRGPGRNRDYAPTYWVASAGVPPPDDGPVLSDRDADVVIVGSGFTGLACALFLAREHGIKATVLEANRVAWGCSTRNGGQGQNASGRLSRSAMDRALGRGHRVEAPRRDPRRLRSLRRPHPRVRLRSAAGRPPLRGPPTPDVRQARGGVRSVQPGLRLCHPHGAARQCWRRDWIAEEGAHGALHEPLGIGVHPAKLAFSYLAAARSAGAKVHTGSPVTAIERDGAAFRVRTPGGTVRARAVAIATGGYTGQWLDPSLRNRIMPILSNSVVTRPAHAGRDRVDELPHPPGRHRHPARCATITGCCPTIACRSAAAAPSRGPTPATGNTWICCSPACGRNSQASPT